jgi:hypothetical protein
MDSAVRLSCPTSTLPVNAVTIPSALTWSQAPALVVHPADEPGAGSWTTTRPSGRQPK